ncbi:hypothetical protein JCM8097_000476 [Rhodosporidiobolus ruineniae]
MEPTVGAFTAVQPSASAPAATSTTRTSSPQWTPPATVCDSFDCLGIVFPLLLSTLASALFFGCTLLAASYAYRRGKQGSSGSLSMARIALVLLVFWQFFGVLVESIKLFSIAAANFGDISTLSRRRASDTLYPLLGVALQAAVLLFLIGKVYTAIRREKWSTWAKRAMMVFLALGWVAVCAGGSGFCTQIRSLRNSASLAPGQPGGHLLDRFVLVWLLSAAIVVVEIAGLRVHASRSTSRNSRHKHVSPITHILNTALKVMADGVVTTWLQSGLALLPALYSLTAIASFASPPPRFSKATQPSRPRQKIKSATPLSTTNYYSAPFPTTSSLSGLSGTVSFGTLPSIPPRPRLVPAIPFHLPTNPHRHSSTHPYSSSTRSHSRTAQSSKSPLVTVASGTGTTTSEHEYSGVLRPTVITEVDGEETLVPAVLASLENSRSRAKSVATARKTDKLARVFAEVSALERGEGDLKVESERREKRRALMVVPVRPVMLEQENDVEKPPLSLVSLRRPSTASSTSACCYPSSSYHPSSLPSQRCSTASPRQYDPFPFSERVSTDAEDREQDDPEAAASKAASFPPARPSVFPPAPSPEHSGAPLVTSPPVFPTSPRPDLAPRRPAHHARGASVFSTGGMTYRWESSFGCRDGVRVV